MGLWLPVPHRVARPGSDEPPVCLAFEADRRRPASGGAPRGAGVVRIWSRSPHSIRWTSRLPCRGVLPRSVLVQFPVIDCKEWGICLTQVARVLWSHVGRAPSIGSSDGDCAPPPSHTTGHAVFRIRRLNPAALLRSEEGRARNEWRSPWK